MSQARAIYNWMTGDDPSEENMHSINTATRADLEHFAQSHNETWLGRINLWGDQSPDLWQYNPEEGLCNFGADFAVPRNDQALVDMIIKRGSDPYEGTRVDAKKIEEILDYLLHDLGGILLFWA